MQFEYPKRALYIVLVLILFAGVPLLALAVGYYLGKQCRGRRAWHSPEAIAQRVHEWRCAETLAGCFELHGLPTRGLEECYFGPVHLDRITRVGPDVPTPFVGYAPQPGPIASGFINAQQCRYDRDVEMPKAAKVLRIFLVGGSVAYGAGASCNASTIGGYLEQRLQQKVSSMAVDRKIEVIPFAAGAWTTTHERIAVEHRVLDWQPDLVISLTGHNDAHWAILGYNILWFRGYQDDYYYRLVQSLLAHNFGRRLSLELQPERAALSSDSVVRRLLYNVRRTHEALSASGVGYLVALQPILACSRKKRTTRESWMMRRVDEEAFGAHYRTIREALQNYTSRSACPSDSSGVYFDYVDLTSLFDDVEGEWFIDNCHFGDRGNERVACALAEKLTTWLRCQVRR